MLLLRIDGQNISPADYNAFKSAEIVIRRQDSDNGNISTSFGGNLTLSGEAYNLVRTQILENPNGRTIRIPTEIYDDCCGDKVLFQGYITYDSLDWCQDECTVTCDMKERGTDADAITCIQSNYIFDNRYGFQQITHPFVRHCAEMRPSLLNDVFLFIGLWIHILIYFFIPLVLLVSLFIVTINAISKIVTGKKAIKDKNNDGIIDLWKDLKTRWDNYITGCGNGHPAPFVRDYILNGCKICGLQFQSTILNTPLITGAEKWKIIGLNVNDPNPYIRLMQLDAPVHKGTLDYTTWIDDNKPLMRIDQYLDFLKKVFNADYKVINGTLIFERKDFFLNNTVILDVSNPKAQPDYFIGMCFNYLTETQPTFARYEYQMDGQDWCGNEAKNRFNDIVAYQNNPNFIPNLKGEFRHTLEASAQRFRLDGIDRDVLSDWEGFFSAIGLRDLLINSRDDNDLLLPLELTFLPKLMIWDGVSDIHNAKVKRFEINNDPNKLFYNNDMVFSAGNDNPDVNEKLFYQGNLYDRFHYINDPRLNIRQGKSYTLRIKRDCDILNKIYKYNSITNQYYIDLSGIVLVNDLGTVYSANIEEIEIKPDMLVIKGKY